MMSQKVDKEIKCGHHLYCRSLTSSSGGRGGGASRGRISEFCVRMRGLPWESTKVSQIFLSIDFFQTDQLILIFDQLIYFQDDIADFLHKCRIVGGHRGITIMEDDRGRCRTSSNYPEIFRLKSQTVNHTIFSELLGMPTSS